MRVTAKRAGWDEALTPEQELDLDPYERAGDDDLAGELVEWDVPAGPAHGAIRVCLVGGQEADPDTVYLERQAANAFCPTGSGGGVDPSCGSGGDGSAPAAAPAATSAELKQQGFNAFDLDDLPPEVGAGLVDSLKEMRTAFPGVETVLDSVRPAKLPKGVPFTVSVEGDSRKLLIDKAQLSDPKVLADAQKSQASGFLASGDGLRGLLIHEMAHAIDKAPFSRQQDWRAVSRVKAFLRTEPPTAKDLSRYGVKEGPHKKEEMFAEALAAAMKSSGHTPWQARLRDHVFPPGGR